MEYLVINFAGTADTQPGPPGLCLQPCPHWNPAPCARRNLSSSQAPVAWWEIPGHFKRSLAWPCGKSKFVLEQALH